MNTEENKLSVGRFVIEWKGKQPTINDYFFERALLKIAAQINDRDFDPSCTEGQVSQSGTVFKWHFETN